MRNNFKKSNSVQVSIEKNKNLRKLLNENDSQIQEQIQRKNQS